MKKLINWLDGKKTIIGLSGLALLDLDVVNNHISVDIIQLLNWGFYLLSGTGFGHKAIKKYNPNK